MKPNYAVDCIKLFNCDCMDFMKETPEGHFELAIVDPPYGIKEKSNRENFY